MIQMIAFTALIFSLNVSAQNKVIYGPDNRHEIYESKNKSIQELSRSVVALIMPNDLVKQGTGFKLNTPLLSQRNICAKERFSDQPTAANCSGFLISHNKVLTAAHCVTSEADCRSTHIVFDYKMKDQNTVQSNFDKGQVYGCKKIIKSEYFPEKDYAIIELDRYVVDRYPLRISNNKNLKKNDEIFVIGHPTGLPAKIADKANIRSDFQAGYSTTFTTNLDTYGGNSGSPVFNAKTLEVEGILIRGETDYVDTNSGCKVSNSVSDDKGRGETVNVISSMVLPDIKDENIGFGNDKPIDHWIWSEVDQTCNTYRNGELWEEDIHPEYCRRGIRYEWSHWDMSCNLFNGLQYITSVKFNHCTGTDAIRYQWEQETQTCRMILNERNVYVIPNYYCPKPILPEIKYVWMKDNTCNEMHGNKWIREIPDYLCGRPKNSPFQFLYLPEDETCNLFHEKEFIQEVDLMFCDY